MGQNYRCSFLINQLRVSSKVSFMPSRSLSVELRAHARLQVVMQWLYIAEIIIYLFIYLIVRIVSKTLRYTG